MTTLQQLRLAYLIQHAVEDKEVSETVLVDELKVAEMERRMYELSKDHGIDFRRNFYVPLDSAHAACQVHKVKNTVQAWSNMADGTEDAVIDIGVLREVASELKSENRAKYGCILAALEKHTDMQSQAALIYVVMCREFHDRLYEKGHMREYAVLTALALAWLAYDMPGLGDQRTRTFYIEVVQQLLVYNIVGDRLYMPGGGGSGVRSAKFGGMPAATQLALISNADIRAWARKNWPEEYEQMVGSLWNQNDNENYFSQMAQQLGWKPSPKMVEARARKTEPSKLSKRTVTARSTVRDEFNGLRRSRAFWLSARCNIHVSRCGFDISSTPSGQLDLPRSPRGPNLRSEIAGD